MAGNKSAIARYRVLDECIHDSSRKWTKKDLIKKCARVTGVEVSPSTFEKDIQHLRHDPGLGIYAPIVYSNKRGYYYSDPDFRLNLDPLKAEHVEFVREALHIVENILDDLQMQHLYEDLSVLAKRHKILSEEIFPKVIGIEESPFEPALKWIQPLNKSKNQKKAVTLVYKPFDMTLSYPKVVSPYFVRRYNQRWFLFGEAHDENKIRVFGLDRILSVTESFQPFRDKPFDPKKYFADIVGVSVPEKGKKVRITFEATPLRAEYIRTKRFHNSLQEIPGQGKKVVFALEAIPNFELESILLSFGEEVKVLSPASFRRRISGRLQKAVRNYVDEGIL